MSDSPTRWSARGFDLSMILQRVWNVDDRLIYLPKRLQDRKLYDFVMTMPIPLIAVDRNRLLRSEIVSYFHIQVNRELRIFPVSVLTAPHGASAALHREPDYISVASGGAGISGREMSVQGESMPDLCKLIGRALKKIVVDETNLKGRYSFAVKVEGVGGIVALLESVGLFLTPGDRSLEGLVVSGS